MAPIPQHCQCGKIGLNNYRDWFLRPYKKNYLVIIFFVSKKWVGRAVFLFFFFFFLNWYECGSEDKDFIYFRTCI